MSVHRQQNPTTERKEDEAHEDSLTHKREVLCPPEVAVVHASHQDVSEEDADILVDLEPDRVEQAAATDQVPVEAPREQPHALVVACAAEDVSEHDAVVVREAENRHAGEDGKYPYGRSRVSEIVNGEFSLEKGGHGWTYIAG